jgi:alkylated DNA nucleotide flippase Atl1
MIGFRASLLVAIVHPVSPALRALPAGPVVATGDIAWKVGNPNNATAAGPVDNHPINLDGPDLSGIGFYGRIEPNDLRRRDT